MKKVIALISLICVLACGMLFAGCSGQASSKSSEKLEASEKAVAQPETDPFNVLIIGNDTRKGTVEINQDMYKDGSARSDTIMIAHVIPSEYKVSIITVPRDTEAEFDGQPGKISTAYLNGGAERLAQAIEELTGAPIKYYMDTNFVDFQKLIDGLGGLTINVPIDMSLQDIVGGETISLPAGTQELDGKEALVLARVRKQYDGNQDAMRQIQDRNIVMTLIEQVASDPATVDKSVDTLLEYVDTNWPENSLKGTVEEFAKNASSIVLFSATGPFDGDTNPEIGQWLAFRDEASWATIMSAANSGENPADVYPQP